MTELKYFIDNEQVDENEFERQLRDNYEEMADDLYEEFLDNEHEAIELEGLHFSPSRVMKLDGCYHCIALDYVDGILKDLIYDFERREYSIKVNGIWYESRYEENEEEEK